MIYFFCFCFVVAVVVVCVCPFFVFFSRDRNIISIVTVEFRYYVSTSELGKTLSYKGLRQLRLISFRWNSWVWPRSVDFRLWFSLQDFCGLYLILSEFLTKDVLKCIVNPTYLIGCCNSTLLSLILKTFLLTLNTTPKIGCCNYFYWLRWYNIRRMKSGSLNYPFVG